MKIRRYVFFKMPRQEDVDELTAEVFLRGWEYATSSKVENPSALFYRIARNLIADFYRAQRPTESLEGKAIAASDDIIAALDEKEEVKQLTRSIRSLKEEYRDVIVMRYLDEMGVGEIAVALEKTPNNVRVLLHRAKKALAKISR